MRKDSSILYVDHASSILMYLKEKLNNIHSITLKDMTNVVHFLQQGLQLYNHGSDVNATSQHCSNSSDIFKWDSGILNECTSHTLIRTRVRHVRKLFASPHQSQSAHTFNLTDQHTNTWKPNICKLTLLSNHNTCLDFIQHLERFLNNILPRLMTVSTSARTSHSANRATEITVTNIHEQNSS